MMAAELLAILAVWYLAERILASDWYFRRTLRRRYDAHRRALRRSIGGGR